MSELPGQPNVNLFWQTADVQDRLKRITELYAVAKTLILKAEEYTHKADLQPMKELRDAFDHVMDCYAVCFGLNSGVSRDNFQPYIVTHLDKAYGHVYRAAYDTLDLFTVILRETIRDDLSGYNNETICAVIPEYYQQIKPSIISLSQKIAEFRDGKDVAVELRHSTLITYSQEAGQLVTYHAAVTSKIPALEEYRKKAAEEHQKETTEEIKKTTKEKISSGITQGIIAVVAAAFGALCSWFFMK